MPTALPGDSNNSRLHTVIAEYLQAEERGESPDRQQFLATHADLASELRAFFDDFDRVEATKLQPVPNPDATFVPQHEPKPGTIFGGRYKLRENIGEGGMGSVWVAEQQQPVKRKVAIKLVKAGMDSKQVLARFEAERQALALMDHPIIAKVFDGGITEHGRPYFVMEYVKGVPFTDYCDKARLSPKERLNLFIPVLPGRAARSSQRHRASRSQAVQHSDLSVRRQAGSESHRLRSGQSDEPIAD